MSIPKEVWNAAWHGKWQDDEETIHRILGQIYTVRYDAVNAMLLNEFLKEHRTVNELRAIVAQQQKQLEALTAGLQKVSAQRELNKAAPQTVLNDN
jgi:hypothetical protein